METRSRQDRKAATTAILSRVMAVTQAATLKLDGLAREPYAHQYAEMERLKGMRSVMMGTPIATTAATAPARLKMAGAALERHQSAHLSVEIRRSEGLKPATMEIQKVGMGALLLVKSKMDGPVTRPMATLLAKKFAVMARTLVL